jgi:glycosyltransferase involved in cell wall biosynthesis
MSRTLVERFGFGIDRLAMVHNGVPVPPPERDGAHAADGLLHVGTVSRLVPVKGLDLVLETAALLRRDLGQVRVSILGDGPLRERLRQRATELGILDCLELRPSQSDPLPFYRSLDVYLNTSLHEGMPLSVLEAMACGKPVVAPRVGGIPEAVTDGREGFLVDGRDPATFAARCRVLLLDRDLREAMGARAQERVRSGFSVQGMAEAYARLYARCPAR